MQNNSGSSLLLMLVGGFLFSLGLREFSWWCQVFYPIKIWIFIPPWVTKTPSGFGNWWICVLLKFWELRRSFGVKELWPWGDNKSCREAIPQAWSARKRGNYFKLEKGNMDGILGRNFLAVWRNFGGNWIIPKEAMEGLKAGLEQHQVVEGVGWDEMILKVPSQLKQSLILGWLKPSRCGFFPSSLEWGWGSSIPNWSRPSSAEAEPSLLCV